MLNEIETQISTDTVTVGIHIRRTDKITVEENKYYPLEKYMKHAKEYFDQVEFQRKTKLTKRQVFVASDDPKVFNEIRNKFPDYEILGDRKRAESASLKSRYTIAS